MNWLWVAAGGALGALARYGTVAALTGMLGTAFPWGTLVVNLTGTFVLGMVGAWTEAAGTSSWLQLGLGTGLLGAFTTFSSIQWEVLVFFRRSQWKTGLLYTGTTVLLGLIMVWLGFSAGQLLLTRAGIRGADGS